jgi:hypothetical protein
MSLFSRLFQTVQTWRRGKRAKVTQRKTVRLEQLDHRRLLSVNFTGNVPIDFPVTQSPGVVVLPDNPSVQHPTIAPVLQPYVFKSGFDIQDIAVTYTPSDDTLSIGLNGPPASPSTTQSVIAGDADDNGNSGTVNPNVLTVEPSFQDFPDFGGSEFEGAFLDLKGTGYADIVAGFSAADPRSPKQYQVANAIVNTSLPPSTPGFGTELPGFEGNVYTVNASAHPSLEFSISHFSQLYQQVTGKPLTPQSAIAVGGFGGSANDTGISETFFPEQNLVVSSATPIPPNPPPSPPILINPHEHRIIDTKHRDLVRVYIFGTSGFHVGDINPATVELNGTHAIAHITRKVKRDEFPFATYVFVADQLNLPPGLTTATLTGQLKTGQAFSSQKEVLNIPNSARAFGTLKQKMGNASFYKSLSKIEARNPSTVISVSSTPVTLASRNRSASGVARIKVNYTPALAAVGHQAKSASESVKARPVVAIDRTERSHEQTKVPVRLRHSMRELAS